MDGNERVKELDRQLAAAQREARAFYALSEERMGIIQATRSQLETARQLIKDCQDDLAWWIVPDSRITDEEVLNTLLGRLDGSQGRAALALEGQT